VGQYLGPAPEHPAKEEKKHIETVFIPTGAIVAPIVTTDGSLSGYGNFEMQLEVLPEDSEELGARMPLLLNAINLRTYRTPMAAGRDKILPDLDTLSRLVMEAAPEAFGKGKVLRAVVTSARPM
jgi:hypothetical protein